MCLVATVKTTLCLHIAYVKGLTENNSVCYVLAMRRGISLTDEDEEKLKRIRERVVPLLGEQVTFTDLLRWCIRQADSFEAKPNG